MWHCKQPRLELQGSLLVWMIVSVVDWLLFKEEIWDTIESHFFKYIIGLIATIRLDVHNIL